METAIVVMLLIGVSMPLVVLVAWLRRGDRGDDE